MPTAQIFEFGYYVIGGSAYPAMVMRRYLNSSKSLVRRVRKKTVRNDLWKENIKIFDTIKKCENGIASLRHIRGFVKGGIAVDDIQFLIDNDGSFVLNDAAEIDGKHIEANMEVIGYLIGLLEERIAQLHEADPKDKQSASSSGAAGGGAAAAASGSGKKLDYEASGSDEESGSDAGLDLGYYEERVAEAEKAKAPRLTSKVLKELQAEDQTEEIKALIKRLEAL